jgi:ferredoxin
LTGKKTSPYEFRFRTGKIVIDHMKCTKCENYVCVKADSLFGTGVLRIQREKPVLTTSFDNAKRLCNECLACELYCQTYGNKGLQIVLDTLDE